jgi:protein ImuA
MTGARQSTLAQLRGNIARIETEADSAADAHRLGRVALGHAEADAALQGGLALGAVHEVFAEPGRHGAAATGFIAALAMRASRRRSVLWVRQDFAAREFGDLAMTGFAEFGFDPSRLIVVRTHDAETALRVAADGLACNGLGAVVAEICGEPKAFDLVASRKLTLAAGHSGVTGLLLRLAADPQASAAETRWLIRAAHSPPAPDWSAWGAPRFEASLVRNRHGPLGRWIMEWTCDECLFSQPTHSQPVAAAAVHRSLPAADAQIERRPRRLQSG